MGENRKQSDCNSCQTQNGQRGLVGGSAGSASARPTTHNHDPAEALWENRAAQVGAGRKATLASKGKIIFMPLKCIFLSVMKKKKNP